MLLNLLSSLLAVAVSGLFLLVAVPLRAAPILIVNPSFEANASDTGTGNGISTTGWTQSGDLFSYHQGTYHLTPPSFFSSSAIPDGTGTVWMNLNGYFTQVLAETLAAGATYDLAAYVGLRSGNVIVGHGYALQLLAGGSVVSQVTGQTTSSDFGAFRQVSLTWTAPAVVTPGLNLEVRLVHQSANSFYPQLAWDLVTLNETLPPGSPVPEPGTGLLSLTAIIGLAAWHWRRFLRGYTPLAGRSQG